MYNNRLNNGISNGNGCAKGDQCCKNKFNGVTANGGCTEDEAVLFSKTEYIPYDPSQEPIFPPELRVCTLCSVGKEDQVLRCNWETGRSGGGQPCLALSFHSLRCLHSVLLIHAPMWRLTHSSHHINFLKSD